MKIGTLTADINVNSVNFDRGMARARKSINGFDRSVIATTKNLAGFAAAIAGVAGAAGGISKFVTIARQMDVLRASLITATGSAEGAEKAFRALEDFAKTTPFALEQSVDAFIKLKNLGLNPSERALLSYGNTASAMGKSLNQLIEAVADASTGEFERLKEFGIKARSEGENVKFTFRGVTTTVKKNAADIQNFLLQLGETEFAGAMAERAKTLDGAISNLEDSFNGLFRAIADRGAADALADAFRDVSEAFDDLANRIASGEIEERLKALGGLFGGFADDVEKMFGEAGRDSSKAIFEAFDALAEAFSRFPENVRALVQLAGVELAVLGDRAEAIATVVSRVFVVKLLGLVDKTKEIGKAIARNLNPFAGEGGQTLEQAFDIIDGRVQDLADAYFQQAEAQIEASRMARLASIEDILAVRDAQRKSFMDQIAAAEEKTARFIELRNQEKEASGLTDDSEEDPEVVAARNKFSELLSLSEQGFGAIESLALKNASTEQKIAAGAAGKILGVAAQHNKKFFEAQKAAGIANAIISTYQGAAEAMKLGPIAGPPAAAAMLALGFQQVNAIRSQSFGGGGGGRSASAPVSTGADAGGAASGGAAQSARNINIQFTGGDETIFTGRQLRSLIEQLNDAQQDGAALITVG